MSSLPSIAADGPPWESTLRRQVLDSASGRVLLDQDVRDMQDESKIHWKLAGGPSAAMEGSELTCA